MFGKVDYEQIVDPELESRLGIRYKFQIDELESLGFHYFCCYSESFAASRLLLLLPLPVVLPMLWGGEIVRLRSGRIHTYNILLVSRDNATHSPVFGLGVMYYSRFSDGTLLVTMNRKAAIADIHRPPLLKRYRKGSITDAWADHQSAIQSLEAAGKHAVREVDFQSYADMVRRETELAS